ncbi:hypothetical protein CL621_04075 [archaeon]|nr:hypothetical protein [archaeon]
MKKANLVIDILILLAILIFLLFYFKPSLIFLNTITAGGDTASHYYPADYLKNYLIPNGKISGWSQGWYAGFPLFQFYFPLSFLIMAFLSNFIGLQVAFKLVTILGIFTLPIFIYFSLKLMKFKFPIPVISSCFSLAFLFMEANSMWGGNIPSTLAGEFSYSISLSFSILFFGFLWKGIKESKYLLTNISLLIIIGLTHIYTLMWVAFTSLFFLISKDFKKNLFYLLKIGSVSFLLLSWFLLPFLFKLGYTSPYADFWNVEFLKLFPIILWPFAIFSIFAIFNFKTDKRIRFFCFSLLISIVFFYLAKHIGLVNIRYVPFIQILLIILGGIGFITVFKKFRKQILPIIAIVFVVIWLLNGIPFEIKDKDLNYKGIDFIPDWIKWNYKGFENKESWNTYKEINDFLKGDINNARVVFEHSSDHNKFGTTRAFESLPLFAGRNTIEGLYMQSISTSVFVFYMQSEYSKEASCPFIQKTCSAFDLDNAVNHLKMFNVGQIIAKSDKLRGSLKNNTEFKLVKRINDYEIYDVVKNKDSYVEVLDYEPIIVPWKIWKDISYEWFKENTTIHMIFDKNIRIPEDYKEDRIDNKNCIVNDLLKEEEIEFTTNCIGKPHLIKVSYFPNWKVEGAKRIYLASPSFMLVYPEKENVRLYYGNTAIDYISSLLASFGLFILGYFIFKKFNK